MKPTALTPATLAHAAAQIARTDNAAGWAKADLAYRAQQEELDGWYEIMARELGCTTRYCFALAKTAAFYEHVRTMHKWRRECLQFSAWEAAAGYWRRDVDIETLLDVMTEAMSAPYLSVRDFESMLFAAFGERELKPYQTQCLTMGKSLFSMGEKLGANHPHYTPIMKAARLLQDIQKGKTK